MQIKRQISYYLHPTTLWEIKNVMYWTYLKGRTSIACEVYLNKLFLKIRSQNPSFLTKYWKLLRYGACAGFVAVTDAWEKCISSKIYPGFCSQGFRLTAGWFHRCAPVVKSDITEAGRHQTLKSLTSQNVGSRGRERKERLGASHVLQRVNPLMSVPSNPTPSRVGL